MRLLLSIRLSCPDCRPNTERLTSFDLKLIAHVESSFICQTSVPARTNVDPGWIRIDQVGCTNSISSIVNTHSGPSQARNRASIASTDIITLEPSRDVGLFLQSHLLHQLLSAAIRVRPLPIAIIVCYEVLAILCYIYYKLEIAM